MKDVKVIIDAIYTGDFTIEVPDDEDMDSYVENEIDGIIAELPEIDGWWLGNLESDWEVA